MSSNVYSTGLRNVGSYVTSGRPFITRQSVNTGDEIKVEFPFVTKNIIIRIPSAPNTAVQTGGGGRFLTHDVSDGQPNPGVFDLGSVSVPGGKTGGDFTFSFYYKETENWVNNQRTFSVTSGNVMVQNFRMRGSAGNYQYTAAGSSFPQPNGSGEWFSVTVTQLTGSTHIYFDDTLKVSTGSDHDWFDDFQFPPNGTAIGGGFDEITVWDTGFTSTEVSELYNSGEWRDPNLHSKSGNLITWHTFDQANDGVDTGGIVEDMANNTEESMYLFSTGDNSLIQGPFTSQTTGMLRIHMLSTGSASGANIIANKHYQELQGYGTSIDLPMKTKEIYLSGVGAQVNFEIIAELTNVPTNSMYKLSGSGIDE